MQPDSCLPSYKALRFLELITLWLISSSPSCQTLPAPPLNIVTFLGGICRQAVRASAAACRDQTRSLVLCLRLPCPPSLLLCHFPKVLPYEPLSVDVSPLHEDAIWEHPGTSEAGRMARGLLHSRQSSQLRCLSVQLSLSGSLETFLPLILGESTKG